MTQEDKKLLLKDLCARLPYGVKIKVRSNDIRTVRAVDMVEGIVHFVESDSISPFGVHIEHPSTFRQVVKPYLRSMDNITYNQQKEYNDLLKRMVNTNDADILYTGSTLLTDFFNGEHIDYRGLIEKGLAIEVTKENNPYNNK